MTRKMLCMLLVGLLLLLGVTGALAQDQELRIATGSSGVANFSFQILSAGGDQQNWITFQSVPPLYFDVDFNLQTGYFNDWSKSDDSKSWTFTVDPAARWSDGASITAQQVIDSWQVQAAPLNSVGRIRTYLGNVVGFADAREMAAEDAMTVEVSGLSAPDESTVAVELVLPDPIFFWRIATAHMAIARAEDVLEHGFNEFWKPENNPIVNGPFILTSFDADNQTAEMIPNPEWWKDGPLLDKVSFMFVTDQTTVGAMALNDQIDASLAAAPSVMRAQMPDYFRQFDAIGFNTFWMQPTREPTSDPHVREALIKSVDWNAVFQAAFPIEGSGVMTTQTLDDIVTCQNPDATGYPYDVEAAQAALAASSYGSAENLPKLRVTPRGSNEFNNRALTAVIEFWRQNLGIENVEFQQDPNSFGDDYDKINLSRDDVVIRFPDAATYMWAAGHSAGPVAGSSMLGGYYNEALEAAVDEALTLAPDDPRRCELALEAQEHYEGDYVIMHFGKPLRTANAREHVKEYYSGPDVSVIEPWKIYIERM
ncbi:MAG: ABC transporter substrate-binding protein [Chloroflexi bacterium]|nr:ABC transporter substrate-binding protein [Chloroflexota bacterium]MYI41331.1 ABC transporter substrate-binding protein [Chloroflexota bacterium]